MAQAVVELAKAVDAEQQQRHALAIATSRDKATPQAVKEERPVRQAGQRVVQRLVFQGMHVGPVLLSELPFGQGADDGGDEPFQAVLEQVINSAGAERPHCLFLADAPGQNDHGDVELALLQARDRH